MDENIEKDLKETKAIMLMFQKKNEKLTNDVSQMQDEMQAINKETGKIKTILEEGVLSSNNDSSDGGGNSIIDEKDLELKIKKILFEDTDLGKTFEKIIFNTIDFEQRKKSVDKIAVDKKLKSMNKSEKISIRTIIISFIIGIAILVAAGVLYKMNTVSVYTIKKGQKFYSFKDNSIGVANQNTAVKFINKDGNKVYFTSGGKKYYTKVK